MSPTVALRTTPQRSNQCSSTDRAWRRLMIQLRALRLSLLSRMWTMSKYGICWLHRCTYKREKQEQTNHEFITLSEKTQCPVHLTSEKLQGNLPQCSHTQEGRVKKHFPTEEAFPEDINQFKEKVKLSSGSLIRKKLREQFLKNKEIVYSQKQHLKSWSKNVKLILLTLCIREFPRQAHSNCLELDSVNCGHEESRTAHGRLHEELAQRDKALRESRIRNIHEVEELKRAQEMRIDEF